MTTTTPTTPETKWQSRIRNDQRAVSRYAKRPHIDRYHDDKRLEQQLREPIS